MSDEAQQVESLKDSYLEKYGFNVPENYVFKARKVDVGPDNVADMAKRHANGRVVSMLEGGYNLTALARSVAVHVKTLMDVGA